MRSARAGALPLVALLCVGLCAGMISGQTPASVQPSGIVSFVTINLNAAVAGTRDGKKANTELQEKFAPRRKQIENEQAQVASLEREMRNSAAALPEAKRSEMEQALKEGQKKLDRERQDYQEELQREQLSFMQQISPKIVAVLNKYANDHHYDVVLDTSNRGGPVLYSTPEYDITSGVIAAYDSK
jgi:Skp family chaperone for outer membrane proteins